MSKPVILLDAGELVALPGANDGDVLTWNGTLNQWQSSPGGGVGTVTSVSLDTAATGLSVSGGTTQTITGAGTFTLGGTLGAGYGGTGLGAPASGDAGKVLAATAGGGYELVTNGNGTVTSVTAGTGLSGGTITTSGTISMPNVGTAGSYGSASSVPVITTDAQGRVSSVTPTSIAIAQSAVADLVTDLAGKVSTSTQVIAGTGLTGGGALSGNVTLSLPSVGTQGTYGSASSVAVVTTDAQGRVSGATTTAIAITQSQVADLVTDLGNKADKSVTATAGTGLTGGGSLAANFSFALDTVGTAASNQGSTSKTVTISTDAYGRVTALSEQAIGSLPASVISSGQLSLSQGGTGIDASAVTAGQVLVGGTGVLALQSVSGDASLASNGAMTVTRLQGNAVSATALGAPDAGKALVWSGSEWQASTIQGGGGGGGLTFFMNYAASSPFPLSTIFDENAGWDSGAITVANDANGTALGTFVTAVGSPAIEVIPAGLWDVNFYAQSSDGVNSTAVRVKIATLAGATQTVIATSDWVYLSDPSAVVQYSASVYVPLTDVTLTDRVEIIFEGRRFVSPSQSITLHFGTGSITHAHTTINAPGGTGLVKVVDGFLQSPATLLVNADVDAAAAIEVSKLGAGTNDYVLTTVAGVPAWAALPSSGVSSLTGTADQVLVGGTSGSPQAGALTLTLPQSIGTTSSPTFAGLTLDTFSGLLRATSGVIAGGASVSLTGEVTGTLPILNGGTNLTSSGATGNLLVSDGSAWSSAAMSGDATIASTGAITLKNTGTAGTYGSASAVPVLTTDAQGRVTSATNTSISITASQVSNLSTSAVTSLTGTTDQVNVSSSTGSVTLSLPQSIASTSSPTFAGLNLTAALTAANGGTGQSSYAIGDLLYASGSTALSKLAGVATGNALISGGVGTAPSWGKIGLTTHVSGVLPIANGGTNNGSLSVAIGAVYYGSGTHVTALAAGTSGQALQSGGAGAPSWVGYPYDLSTASVGTYGNSQTIFRHVAVRDVTITSTGSIFRSLAASSGTVTVTVQKNGATAFSVTFSVAGSTTGSVPSGTTVTLAAGDVLTVVTPSTADATLAGVYFTLKATALGV
jgi:hypothetical protein